MSKEPCKPFPWKLAIFPLFEVAFFIAAILVGNYFLSFLFIIIAGIFLSFSIHIFFHECVHVRDEYPMSINIINTLLLGLPFDGYRVHHFNHHTYANDLNDFSSTWHIQKGKKTAFSACRYSFGWLRQLAMALKEPKPFDKAWGDVVKIKARIEPQKIALFLFCIAIAFIGLKAFLFYFTLVYLGWGFSALHNYGQHPPIEKEPICTYANKAYNVIFFNNGLHWEHHDKPWLSWDLIECDSRSSRIKHAHLIEPCYRSQHD